MYLIDANVLIYATDVHARQHQAARDWLDEKLAGPAQYVGLPWPSLLAYLRVVTNPRIYAAPAAIGAAWARAEAWLAHPAAWIPAPGTRHQQIFAEIVGAAGPTGNLLPDAHLAALAREHGLTVVSADSDFAKFAGLAWIDPVGGGGPARRGPS